MSLDSRQASRWPEPLARRLGADAGIDEVADAALTIWGDIEIALSPIIGHRGVAALFNRSLQLVSAMHPWLAVGRGSALDLVEPSTLEAALREQSAEAAAAGAAALFRSVHDLIASLIGAQLADRLLHSVWTPSTGATTAQDLLP